jgi:hypothetical protein
MTFSPWWPTRPWSRFPTSRSSPAPPAPGALLVTANIKDFVPLDGRYRAASQAHAGLILVSAKTFPQDRSYTAAITSALSALLDQPAPLQPGQVTFLPRR